MITDFHAKYLAHELTKRCAPDSSERLAGAVASAQVDGAVRAVIDELRPSYRHEILTEARELWGYDEAG